MASLRAMVAAVEAELGPIEGLVHNADIDVIKPFVESTEEKWDRILAANRNGTIACCRAVLPAPGPAPSPTDLKLILHIGSEAEDGARLSYPRPASPPLGARYNGDRAEGVERDDAQRLLAGAGVERHDVPRES
jgi:NAD(P)-dependent dehydrogenase (short-subunit alcohol dehydrogenase family)